MPFRGSVLDRWIERSKADDEEEDYSQTNQRGNNPKSKKQDIKINNNKRERKIIPNLKLSDKQRMRNYKTNIAPKTRDRIKNNEEDDGLISKIREAFGLKNPKEITNLMEDVTVHQAPEYIPPSEAKIPETVVGAGGRIPARLRIGGSRGARVPEEGAGVFESTRSRSTDEIGSTPSEDIGSI